VKVLYVRNLTQDCSEEKLKEAFEAFGKVDRVKKIKDYAFIHFEERDHAVNVSLKIFLLSVPKPFCSENGGNLTCCTTSNAGNERTERQGYGRI
ncbi:unnamed protein product, partial [Nesidiocoris tenuis]